MRSIRLTFTSLLVALPLVWEVSGCDSVTCEDLANCAPVGNNDSGSAGADNDGGDGAGCDSTQSPSESPCVVNDRLGVFVSPSGSDGASGTKAAPFKTITHALAEASGKNVYVCAGSYVEQVTINAVLDGARVFGGFDCATWSYSASMRPKVAPASGVALTVKGVSSGATIEDVEFDAPDATAAGTSSMGAIVDTAINVSLRRVKIVAGKGAPGQQGTDGAKGNDGPSVTDMQKGAPAACPALIDPQNGGGWTAPSLCGSRGGRGGAANQGSDGSA